MSAERARYRPLLAPYETTVPSGFVIVMSPGFQIKRAAALGSILSVSGAPSADSLVAPIPAEVRNRSRW